MIQPQILVVDDEPDIRELVRYNLAQAGYRVTCAGTGEDGLREARNLKPDVLVLDIMLPGIEGLDICKLLKSDQLTNEIRILIISARNEEEYVVKGLEIGADDYLPKPFSPKVLVARVQNLLRRNSYPERQKSDQLKYQGIILNPSRFEASIEDQQIELTSTEFKILKLFIENIGVVHTRSQVVQHVHGAQHAVTDRSIDVQIVNLRKKLGKYGEAIETVRGVGYRLKET